MTFVYFILNSTVIPSSDKSSGLSPPFFFFRQFLQLAKTKAFKSPHARLPACVTLYEGRLLISWIAFRTCLRSYSARNSVDRSWTDLRPPPVAIQVNNQSLIPSTDVIQLTLTLKMTTAQVVEMSVTVNNSPIKDYFHPDDQNQPNNEMTPGFKQRFLLK